MSESDSARRHHAVIVPDTDGADGVPVCLSADTSQALIAALHAKLARIGVGWCFVFLDGRRVRLSGPQVVFQVDGEGLPPVASPDGPVWAEDGRFHVPGPKGVAS